jgi:predicted Rossmann-fold nucleotide-binding protein
MRSWMGSRMAGGRRSSDPKMLGRATTHSRASHLKANFSVVVFGGRHYAYRRTLYCVLDGVHARRKITCIIGGGMSGADRLALQWAEDRGIDVDPYAADWDNIHRPGAAVKRNGRDAAAGPFRNERMLREGRPQAAIAFPGGKGTLDMFTRCLEIGITPFRA